jgi:hypothetical protein
MKSDEAAASLNPVSARHHPACRRAIDLRQRQEPLPAIVCCTGLINKFLGQVTVLKPRTELAKGAYWKPYFSVHFVINRAI